MKTASLKRARIAAACALAILLSARASAQEYKVLVPQLSPATTDLYRQLAAAVIKAGGGHATIEVVPFSRAIHLLEAKQADMLFMEVENPIPAKAAKATVDCSTTTVAPLVFVLYANKARPVDPKDLEGGNPRHLVVETDVAHVDYFPFQAVGSTSIDSSLNKLALGRIDAYVFAQPSTDVALKRLRMKNVSRQMYRVFNLKVILQKGARGGAVDRLVSRGLEKMNADGSYEKLMGEYTRSASKFLDWQP